MSAIRADLRNEMAVRCLLGAAALMLATVAEAQPDGAPSRGTSQVVTFKPGEVGPYYCPAPGRLKSARILSGGDRAHLILGKMVIDGGLHMTGVGGGPRCAELSSIPGPISDGCVKLSEASASVTKVAVVCVP
jgi:hypothetical protein